MKIEHGTLEGNLRIDYDLELHGTAKGSMIVLMPAVLRLHGTCTQDIILEPRSKAYLHGTVLGNVMNNGGYLEIYGTVNGSVTTSNGGTTHVDPNAVVQGALR